MTGKIVSLKSTTKELEEMRKRVDKFEVESKVLQFLIFSVIVGVILLGFSKCTVESSSSPESSNVCLEAQLNSCEPTFN